MTLDIGIMQGRLTPAPKGRFQCFPRDEWEAEFPRARTAGLTCIEWIYDSYGSDVNPLATDAGIARIRNLAAQWQVEVRSICADWFMDYPLLRTTAEHRQSRIDCLRWLIDRSTLLGVRRVVLPFVDASRIESNEEMIAVADLLVPLANQLAEAKVEIHLETNLCPSDFGAFIQRLPWHSFKVNYDSGNSASLGYAVTDEFRAYGNRIGSIHIKDRVHAGGTVPLGTGSADFDSLCTAIAQTKYHGDLILQVARAIPGEEVAWAIRNRDFVASHLASANQAAH